jgi:dihydropyrimidine dehydrogenase (NAD+) subunit PreA
MAQMTQAFPDRAFSGIGGISGWDQALSYFLLGCGTVQVATAAMLDHAIGPDVIRDLTTGMAGFLDRNADRGWTSLGDFRGLRRGAVVPHARIGRPVRSDAERGYDMPEGYAAPEAATETVAG